MKTITALTILLLLVFSVDPAALPQESTDQGNAVMVAWQVNIDNQRDFDFGRLRVLIQYRPGKGYAWTALPLTKPDSTGRFVATVPAGNYLSLQIGTEDPTVRRTLVKSTAANNYVVSEGIPPTIFEQEMYIAPGPTREMERS